MKERKGRKIWMKKERKKKGKIGKTGKESERRKKCWQKKNEIERRVRWLKMWKENINEKSIIPDKMVERKYKIEKEKRKYKWKKNECDKEE